MSISYGDWPNDVFLLFFGFLPDNNQHNSVVLFHTLHDLVTCYHGLLHQTQQKKQSHKELRQSQALLHQSQEEGASSQQQQQQQQHSQQQMINLNEQRNAPKQEGERHAEQQDVCEQYENQLDDRELQTRQQLNQRSMMPRASNQQRLSPEESSQAGGEPDRSKHSTDVSSSAMSAEMQMSVMRDESCSSELSDEAAEVKQQSAGEQTDALLADLQATLGPGDWTR